MAGETYQPADRRPIAARDLAVSRRIAGWLAARGASPNAISMAGLAAGLAAGALLWATSRTEEPWSRIAWVLGAACIQLRLAANLFDGMVAVERGVASPVGELYNEVPDRISDAAALIGLGHAAGGSPALGYLAACAALFTAYVRAIAKVAGAPQDYSGPMAKQQRMVVVILASLLAGLAPSSWQPTWNGASGWGIPAAALALIIAGSLATSIRRLARAARRLKGLKQDRSARP